MTRFKKCEMPECDNIRSFNEGYQYGLCWHNAVEGKRGRVKCCKSCLINGALDMIECRTDLNEILEKCKKLDGKPLNDYLSKFMRNASLQELEETMKVNELGPKAYFTSEKKKASNLNLLTDPIKKIKILK